MPAERALTRHAGSGSKRARAERVLARGADVLERTVWSGQAHIEGSDAEE